MSLLMTHEEGSSEGSREDRLPTLAGLWEKICKAWASEVYPLRDAAFGVCISGCACAFAQFKTLGAADL